MSRFVLSLMLGSTLALLAACNKAAPAVDANKPVSNAEFAQWTRELPSVLKAPAADIRSRQRGVFQACLKATTAGHAVTCRCNVRAYMKSLAEPERSEELDRAWMASAGAFGGATKAELAIVAKRLPAAKAVYSAGQKAVNDLQALCGTSEAL